MRLVTSRSCKRERAVTASPLCLVDSNKTDTEFLVVFCWIRFMLFGISNVL